MGRRTIPDVKNNSIVAKNAGLKMKSYSLLTLLLLIVIAALSVSQFVMMRQLADAQAEIDTVRRKYGYIRIENENSTYVSRIADNEQGENAYRIRVPSGSRYLLHLTDATFEKSDYPVDPIPTKTISLNGWQEGADAVLSYSIYWAQIACESLDSTSHCWEVCKGGSGAAK